MALSKYTDPAVQNKTQDDAADYIDDLHSQPATPGKNKTSKEKKSENKDAETKDQIKGFKEGNKDDTLVEKDLDYEDVENDFSNDDDEHDFSNEDEVDNDDRRYGKGL